MDVSIEVADDNVDASIEVADDNVDASTEVADDNADASIEAAHENDDAGSEVDVGSEECYSTTLILNVNNYAEYKSKKGADYSA